MIAPARQPQHCEHECVCGRFGISAIPFSFPCPANINKDYDDCEHDTRTSTPAPESLCEGCTAEDEMCGKVPSECYSRYQENIEKAKAHDAQVAKAERERVLETLEDLRKWSNGEYNEAYLSDNEREMRIHNDYGCKIWGVMESLRTQPENTTSSKE